MTGLDYKCSNLSIREQFAVTKEIIGKILAGFKDKGAGGCVVISTCNRMELYTSIQEACNLQLSKILCATLSKDFSEYGAYFMEREGEQVMEHLCRVASGLDSQIMGDDQIITQVREALELSRNQNCTDGYIETMFNMSIHAAKAIKTKVLANSLGTSSVPGKTVEKIKTMRNLAGQNALVIGNGRIGRMVSELLLRENMNVTVTLRSHKRDTVQIPEQANVISYDERYKEIEKADIAVSATASPHLTLSKNEMSKLKQLPKIIVDLAVPRDVEPSIKSLPGVTLLTIDDISGGERHLPPESISITESIIAEHIAKYKQWLLFKENKNKHSGWHLPMFFCIFQVWKLGRYWRI